MTLRKILISTLASIFVAWATVAVAQQVAIGKSYEDGKAAEISAARLRLATRPAVTGMQELNEAEGLLRQLKTTAEASSRRKIAAELDLAVTRLDIVANDPTGR
ncbi:hypothetical protein CU669_20095 [Paramagnetospirillum kuznetsovii]|uniref:Uncharacterized protein n=1 Tax=Paramagnetospirillum kuznetsovii TaxID=2053833 RepID=A0A364NTA6_9PROT|nr:hypothetical protein [Paramagnetospirillum kuznetsovii]RAU20117.1 hypothetical protein CU669_20095 [Paramagnetospirillum kuznetsovii]